MPHSISKFREFTSFVMVQVSYLSGSAVCINFHSSVVRGFLDRQRRKGLSNAESFIRRFCSTSRLSPGCRSSTSSSDSSASGNTDIFKGKSGTCAPAPSWGSLATLPHTPVRISPSLISPTPCSSSISRYSLALLNLKPPVTSGVYRLSHPRIKSISQIPLQMKMVSSATGKRGRFPQLSWLKVTVS